MLARSSEPPLPSAALTYHGQGGATDEAEDEFVFSRLFSDNGASPLLHNGTFIEIGAHDGIVFSNSLFFERKLGWSGLLVEPSPGSFTALQRHRGEPSRNTLVNAVVGSCEGGATMVFQSQGLFGKAVAAPAQVASMKKHADRSRVKEVPCRRLDVLMSKAKLRRVDLFSLDTEGYELEVLRTYDWSVPLGALIVEQDAARPGKDEEVRKLLRRHHMTLARRIGFGRRNELWLGPSLAHRADAARREWRLPANSSSWGCAASPARHCCERHRVKTSLRDCLRRHQAFGITF